LEVLLVAALEVEDSTAGVSVFLDCEVFFSCSGIFEP
jgi:hypothetical protein